MMPSGAGTPVGGGSQSVPQSLLRTNSGVLGGGAMPTQQAFSSLVSPRTQFGNNGNAGNMGLLGNISNVSSLLNHSMGNGGMPMPNTGIPNGGVELDPLSFEQMQGQSQLDGIQGFQQQFGLSQQNQQQAQLRGVMGSVKLEPQMGHAAVGHVKLEPQMGHSDQNGSVQQLQSLRGIGSVKMEPQQLQFVRALGPVKLERQQSDSALFLQQQQQQQLLQMSRQSSQPGAAAQMNLLQQQRILQLQQQHQQQQQQILKMLPQQQRNQLQLQQQLQQSVPARPQGKPGLYEPGTCARRLTFYMCHQQHRPEDNNIEFWRKFVSEFFAPNAKKRWCVSLYGSGRQTTGVFPQDVWHCEICNRKPGRGFETTAEVLPRLFQIKYASGTLEELLYVDMPREYQNASGQIVLDYAKAVQESVFEQLRVVREGQLRVVFSPELKICSWEFCARKHEELIPRRLLMPQASQLGAVVQKYQNASQNSSAGLSAQDLQSTCNSFVASARQLAKSLEVPLVNDLGYTKRYVRCLQISEVVNSMKDLVDYSRETGTGPMDSLINFPRRGGPAPSGLHTQQSRQSEDPPQPMVQNTVHNDQSSILAPGIQLASLNNGVMSANGSVNNMASSCTTTTIAGLLHQNSMNSRQENQMGSVSSPYGGANTAQIPSASSSNSVPPSQPNPSSPFPSPPSTSNNNAISAPHNAAHLNSISSANMPVMQQTSSQAQEADPNDSQSSVRQILQEMMISSQLNSSMGNDMKGINGINGVTPTLNGGTQILNGINGLVGHGGGNNASIGGMGYGNMIGMGPSNAMNGLRAAAANNAMSMNGRVGMNHVMQDLGSMSHYNQQQDMAARLLSGLGPANGFNNLQFDWKPSP